MAGSLRLSIDGPPPETGAAAFVPVGHGQFAVCRGAAIDLMPGTRLYSGHALRAKPAPYRQFCLQTQETRMGRAPRCLVTGRSLSTRSSSTRSFSWRIFNLSVWLWFVPVAVAVLPLGGPGTALAAGAAATSPWVRVSRAASR